MKISETDGNTTCTYEVVIDEDKLKELIVLLDRDCYVERVGNRMLEAYTESEANRKIANLTNAAGIKENMSFDGVYLTEYQAWYHGLPYEAHYEAVFKDSVDLVRWIKYILENRKSKSNFDKEYCLKCFEKIKNYKDSIDFVPFEGRVQLAESKLNEALSTINQTKVNLLELVKAYGTACIEAKLNGSYNFQRLAELYVQVLACFKLVLVEKTIKYPTR